MAAKNYITLTLEFHKEGRRWVGVCKELGTSTYHRSLPELEKQLSELVTLHLNCLETVGERERFFKENNIKLQSIKPKFATISIPENENVFISSYVRSFPALVGTCSN